MTPIEAARREWPALEWVETGGFIEGYAGERLVAMAWRNIDGAWFVFTEAIDGSFSLAVALRGARYALPAHVEHVPRTPLAVARQDWPALRWTCERDRFGGWCLRGHAGRSVVATATKWPGRGWLVSGEDGLPVRAASLRAGLRAVRWGLL